MGLYDHMHPIERGRPSWMSPSHFANVRDAAASVRRRVDLRCWLDIFGRRVFFGRESQDGHIAGLFDWALFHPDGTEIRFGPMQHEIDPEAPVRCAQLASAPEKVKEQWAAKRKWCDETEAKNRKERACYSRSREQDAFASLKRASNRQGMGRKFRPMVTVP